MCFLFNFLAALTSKFPNWTYKYLLWLEDWIISGCERYTPVNHRWRDEPMF